MHAQEMIEALEALTAAAHLGCFGAFDFEDRICRGRCALRIRCAVARSQYLAIQGIEAQAEAEEGLLTTH